MSVETPTPAAPPERKCPRCGSHLDPDQDWCLACGTAVRTRVASSPRWRGPVAIVGAVLALAAAAIVLGLLELSNDDGAPQEVAATPPPAQTPPPTPTPALTPTPPAASPSPGATESPSASPTESPSASPSPGATESPSATATVSPSATATASPGTTAEPGGTATTWPSGESAWTVILQSATNKAKAEKKASDLSTGGTEAGVLHSDDFSSLRKGYWVVFSGQYDSQAKAQRALTDLRSKASSAYVRFVKPR